LGKACSTHADEIVVRKLNAREHLEDLGIDRRIILKLILKKKIMNEGMDWIHLSEGWGK
jgi:hypothetical protein